MDSLPNMRDGIRLTAMTGEFCYRVGRNTHVCAKFSKFHLYRTRGSVGM